MNLSVKLTNVISFAEDEDSYGPFKPGTTLESVVFGTLRKDLAIVRDIRVLMDNESTGVAMIALCRILVEDYIHLSYLINSHVGTENLLINIANHPKIETYLNAYRLKEWGIELTEAEELTLAQAKDGFDRNKADFLRNKKEDKLFNSDDYWRTWTKKSLAEIIKDSGIPSSDKRSEMALIQQLYNVGSDIIHHNAFLIWQFSRGHEKIILGGLPQASTAFALSTFAKIVNISLKVKYAEDASLYEAKLTELSDLI